VPRHTTYLILLCGMGGQAANANLHQTPGTAFQVRRVPSQPDMRPAAAIRRPLEPIAGGGSHALAARATILALVNPRLQ